VALNVNKLDFIRLKEKEKEKEIFMILFAN